MTSTPSANPAGDRTAAAPSPLEHGGLSVEGLSVGYHGVPVIRDASLYVAPGELVAVLGPNGAGKTTLLSAVAGLLSSTTGSFSVGGAAVSGLSAHVLARRGVRLVPEGRALFPSLTVREHLRLVPGRRGTSQERLLDMLPELDKCLDRKVGLLSGGEQQMLAIGRALLTNPKLLIMDEPSEGLAPTIVEGLVQTIKDLAAGGMGLFVVEQNLGVATSLAERQLVMVTGSIATETTATELAGDPAAQRRYLGVEPLPDAA